MAKQKNIKKPSDPVQKQKARQADFSPTAVNNAVVKQTFQKPYVLYPAAIGILGIAASLLVAPVSLFIIPAIAGTAIGAGAWLVDSTLRREYHARAYLAEMHMLLTGQLESTIKTLHGDFIEQGSTRGIKQLDRLSQKFDTFRQMLERKLTPGELTHARYLGMTEQVFLAGLDNLKQVSNIQKGLSAIDSDGLKTRIDILHEMREIDALQKRELTALESRILLFNEQNKKLEQLLTQNEEALTQIDLVMAAIAGMNTEPGHASVDMETAMQELKALAERADKYSRTI